MRYSRSKHPGAFLLLALGMYACGPAPSSEAVRLQSEMREGKTIIAAIPAAGVRISARVPPAVELENGKIIRLAAGRALPDSSYFVEAPWGPRPAGTRLRGVLRVSFCRASEVVCRTAAIPVDLPD